MEDAMQHPTVIPPLPHTAGGWSINVVNNHHILNNAFNRALGVLRQEDSDPLRLRVVSENLVNDMVPILEGMESDGISREYIEQCAHALGPLVYELHVAALSLDGV